MDAARRRQLQAALRARYPWVSDPEVGPGAVEAGECDRCGLEARLVLTWGPGTDIYLGRRCVEELGEAAGCSGHRDNGHAARDAMGLLPPEADAVTRLSWVATGELQLEERLVRGLQRELSAR